MKVKIKRLTKMILGIGSAITAFVSGVGHLGVIPLVFAGKLSNSILLWILATVLLVETSLLTEKGLKFKIDVKKPLSSIALAVSLSAYLIGIVFLTPIMLPVKIQAFVGFIYILLAFEVLVQMFK